MVLCYVKFLEQPWRSRGEHTDISAAIQVQVQVQVQFISYMCVVIYKKCYIKYNDIIKEGSYR